MNNNYIKFISFLIATFSLTMSNSKAQINLALGSTATQSSTCYNGYAERAIDGNTSGDWGHGSVTATCYNHNAWWQIDMGQIYEISTIDIWNRTGCCETRLSDFYIFVSDVPFTSYDLTTTLNQSDVFSAHITNTPYPDVSTVVSRSGRYVRVQLTGTNYLSLAEVQVFGTFSICFEYDDSGNRTDRTIAFSGAKSGKMDPPDPEIFEEIVEETKFTIYPNPTDGLLQIDISNLDTETPSSIKIFDVQGRIVYENNTPGLTNSVDMSERNPGVYILMLQAGGKTREWKIIKE